MYKKSVITDEISQSIKEAADLAERYCLDALEIRSVNEHNPFQMTKSDIEEVKQVADEHGLLICCVSSPLFKINLQDSKAIEEHIESFKKIMDVMHFWNVSLIRGFDFLHCDLPDKEELIEECYRKIIPIAADAGVTIVLESEPSVNSYDMKTLFGRLSQFHSTSIKAVFDPGNEVMASSVPPYPDGYELLRPYLGHVHIKDMKHDGTPALLGAGDVDFKGIFRTLKKEYNGFASVETHFRFADMNDGRDYVHPQGSSFSNGGKKATEAYFKILEKDYCW
jgi:sugar phosphate isomerase/epimerase